MPLEQAAAQAAAAGGFTADLVVPRITVLPDAPHDRVEIYSELPNTELELRWDSSPNQNNHDWAFGANTTTDGAGHASLGDDLGMCTILENDPLPVVSIADTVVNERDIDIAAQQITGYISDPDLVTVWPDARLPRALKGRLTVYASPEDRALLVSRILFRSRNRVGQLRPEDIPEKSQRYMEKLGRLDLISYEGKRTDFFGHSYFTTNPQVSSDLIQLVRYGRRLGEPGRELIKTGPVTWEFPTEVRKTGE